MNFEKLESTASSLYDWDFLDAIYCLTITGSPRTETVLQRMETLGMMSHRNCFLFTVDRNDISPAAGCWEAHRSACMHALQHRFKNALILENDVVFDESFCPQRLGDIARAATRLPPSWRVFFLGHVPSYGAWVTANCRRTLSHGGQAYIGSTDLFRLVDANPGWSFQENRGLIKTLIPSIDGYITLDSALFFEGGMYAYYPMVAFQDSSVSSISPDRECTEGSTYKEYAKRAERDTSTRFHSFWGKLMFLVFDRLPFCLMEQPSLFIHPWKLC